MLDLVHELPMADTNPDNQPSQFALSDEPEHDRSPRPGARRRLGAGASTPSTAVCSADLADHGADAMTWIVQCGCGTVYGTDDPLILVCPNVECTWDFGPGCSAAPQRDRGPHREPAGQLPTVGVTKTSRWPT
jgi:hypothetical protein